MQINYLIHQISSLVSEHRWNWTRNWRHIVCQLDAMDGYIRIEQPMRNRWTSWVNEYATKLIVANLPKVLKTCQKVHCKQDLHVRDREIWFHIRDVSTKFTRQDETETTQKKGLETETTSLEMNDKYNDKSVHTMKWYQWNEWEDLNCLQKPTIQVAWGRQLYFPVTICHADSHWPSG